MAFSIEVASPATGDEMSCTSETLFAATKTVSLVLVQSRDFPAEPTALLQNVEDCWASREALGWCKRAA